MDLNATSSLITGGASGIGLATAKHVASLGGRVVIADLNEEKGKAVAEELGGVFVKTDVSDEADEYLRTHSLEEMPRSWEKGHAFRRGASTPEERAARRQLGRDDRSPSDNASQSSTDPLPLPDTRADDPYPTLASARAAGLP